MRFALLLAKALAVVVVCLIAADLVVRQTVPHSIRLSENFSAHYLQRAIREDGLQNKIVVAGDSALWGYRLAAADAAVSRLAASKVPVENFSFEGGSTANTFALLRLLQAEAVRPQAILFNVNLKEFNAADSAYRTLYPPLEQITWRILTRAERALLKQTRSTTLDARVDATIDSFWALYGMRADIREELFGRPDAVTAVRDRIESISGESARARLAHVPKAENFLGTYDLSPLTEANTEVVFLRKIARLLRDERIPGIALLTPTNHGLLHDYIDGPEYQDQLAYVKRLLKANGVRVLDYDRAFSSNEFLDNDHLTAAGNLRLSQLLRREISGFDL